MPEWIWTPQKDALNQRNHRAYPWLLGYRFSKAIRWRYLDRIRTQTAIDGKPLATRAVLSSYSSCTRSRWSKTMAARSAALSACGKQPHVSGGHMKKGTSKLSAAGQMTGQMTPELLTQLRAAAELPEEEINIGDPDAPEATNWVGAVRGRFYKPRKVQRTLRIDADVLAYFEAQGPGHLTRMNRVLRASMLRGLRRQRQRKKQHA